MKVVADSTQNNFQQLLNEIRETRFERVHTVITSPSGTSSCPLITSAWSSEERPQSAGTRSQESVGFASHAHTQTATIPSVAQTVCLQSTHNTQNNSRPLLSEIREMRDDRTHTAYSLPSSNHSLMSSAMSSEARIMTRVDCSHGPVGFTSLAHCQTTIAPSIPSFEISEHGMPMTSTHHATNTAFGGVLTTEVTNSHEN